MGYEVQSTLPFTYSLAQTFPVCDRYFASVMAQTYPNRRYLMAGYIPRPGRRHPAA